MTQTTIGYTEAKAEIAAGRARAFALWVLLSEESARDGYALKPAPWEGSGEYQHVTFDDGRDVFVRIPENRSLPIASAPKAAPRKRLLSMDSALLIEDEASTLGDFLTVNDFEAVEAVRIMRSLETTGEAHGDEGVPGRWSIFLAVKA